MNKSFILSLFITFTFFSSCNRNNVENRNPQTNITTDTLTVDTVVNSVNFEIINDTAFFKKGTEIIEKTYINPKVFVGGTPDNPKEIMDDGFLLANCMVVLRNIRTAGHFCHTPEVDKVEITTTSGKQTVINKTDRKSKIMSGSDFTSDFLGNRFNSPGGKWGLITVEAEGEMYGFLILNNLGEINEINLPIDSTLTGEILNARFNEFDELIWQDLVYDMQNLTLKVNKNGDFYIN